MGTQPNLPPLPPMIPPGAQVQASPVMLVPVDASGYLAGDVACRKCGYNLHGAHPEGSCPECGTAVGISTQGDLLRFADPGWVEKLAKGVSLMLWGLLIAFVVGIFGSVVATVVVRATGPGQLSPVFTIVNVLAGAVSYYGVWLLTSVDPSGVSEDRYARARKFIRFALLFGIVVQVLQPFAELGAVQAQKLLLVILIIGIVSGLVGSVGEFAKYTYLGHLAARIPDDKLMSRANWLRWALSILLAFGVISGMGFALWGLLAGGGGTGPAAAGGAPGTRAAGPRGGAFVGIACVAGLLTLFYLICLLLAVRLQYRLGKQFKQQAALARQTWAATTARPVARPIV